MYVAPDGYNVFVIFAIIARLGLPDDLIDS
jgi:hypothetical protein